MKANFVVSLNILVLPVFVSIESINNWNFADVHDSDRMIPIDQLALFYTESLFDDAIS